MDQYSGTVRVVSLIYITLVNITIWRGGGQYESATCGIPFV